MARIDDDIVAKASFYAGLSQTYAPEEVPADIRTNGNSLLRDIVNSVCNDEQVDRGSVIEERTTSGEVFMDEDDGLVPQSVIYDGKELTLVDLKDFLTTYKNNKNVATIYHSTNTSLGVDHDGYTILTYVTGTLEIISDRAISIDDEGDYLKVDCRNAVKGYIVDFLAYRMASLYQQSTKEECGNNMLISYNQCKKKVHSALMLADPMEAYKRIQHANGSPNYGKGRSRDALRGE